MRAELVAIVDALLVRGARPLSLDEVSDAVGAIAITQTEIAMLFEALEARGCSIGEESHEAPSIDLHPTLRAARDLRERLGRVPSVDEIAAHAGLDPGAVRRALFFARIVQR